MPYLSYIACYDASPRCAAEPDVASSDARNIRTAIAPATSDAVSARVAGADRHAMGVESVAAGGVASRSRSTTAPAPSEPQLLVSGRKWWATGAQHPHCALYLVMGRLDPAVGDSDGGGGGRDAHSQHSIVLVPRDTPGVRLVRALTVFGYDDAPEGHAEVRTCSRACLLPDW